MRVRVELGNVEIHRLAVSFSDTIRCNSNHSTIKEIYENRNTTK